MSRLCDPPTEPTPQERTMTSPTQRRHDTQPDDRTRTEKSLDLIADQLRDVVHELRVGKSHYLLAEIRDALTSVSDMAKPMARDDWLDEPVPVPRPELVDVDPDERHPGVLWDKIDALTRERDDLKHENEGLSWRWAECADERDAAVTRAERAEAERDEFRRARDNAYDLGDGIAARHWADVERLTRERDEAERRRIVGDKRIRQLESQVETKRARYDDLIDRIRAAHLHARDGSKAEASLAYVLDRDDERGAKVRAEIIDAEEAQ